MPTTSSPSDIMHLVQLRNTPFSAVAYITHFVNVGFRWWIEFFLLILLSISCGVPYLLCSKATAISVKTAWWSGLSQGLQPCGLLTKTMDTHLEHWDICRHLRHSPTLSNHHFTETSQLQPGSSPAGQMCCPSSSSELAGMLPDMWSRLDWEQW